jgi:hypothetical protein
MGYTPYLTVQFAAVPAITGNLQFMCNGVKFVFPGNLLKGIL